MLRLRHAIDEQVCEEWLLNRYLFPVLVGLVMAAVLSAWALVVGLAQGPSASSVPRGSLSIAIGGYFAAGILGGLLVGALRRFTGHVVGVAFVGAFVGATIYAGFGLVAIRPERWSVVLPTGAAGGAIIGAIVGVIAKRAVERIRRL
jgi:hypothetical protein